MWHWLGDLRAGNVVVAAGALVASPMSLWARPEIHVLIAAPGEWPAGVEAAVRSASNTLRQFDLVVVPVPSPRPMVDSVESWLAKAEEALARAETDEARAAYDKALLVLEQSGQMSRPMAELFFSRARFFYAQNDVSAAKRELVVAVGLDPSLVPDPVQYSPKIIKLHKELSQDAKKKATAVLSIGAPEGAIAWVDGLRYESPRALRVGVHYVRIEQEGFIPFVQKLSVTTATTITASLEPDLYAQDQRLREGASKDPMSVVPWAQGAGVREVLVLSPEGSQWSLSRIDVSQALPTAQSKASGASLEGALVSLIEPLGPLSAPTDEVNEPAVVWRRPIFWIPVGLGLLGGALLSVDLLNENVGARPSIDLRGRP